MTNQPKTETLPSHQLVKKGLLSVNSTNNKPFTGITIEYYYNGKNPFDISKVKKTTVFRNGKKDGPREEFHENGQLQFRENYINGKRDGLWESYYENGQLERKGNYENGDAIGSWEEFHENSQLWSRGNFNNDEKHGLWKKFYENGQLEYIAYFKDGKKDSVVNYCEENGQHFHPNQVSFF